MILNTTIRGCLSTVWLIPAHPSRTIRINFAVVRALEIIGEAAKRLPEELRPKLSKYPLERNGRYA
jgi:hypothetical protein